MRPSRPFIRDQDNFFLNITQENNDFPIRLGLINQIVTIQVLPEINQWFHTRLTDNVAEDENNNELTAYITYDPILNITFELRDIHTNQLQPVITEPNNKVYPNLTFILDIE